MGEIELCLGWPGPTEAGHCILLPYHTGLLPDARPRHGLCKGHSVNGSTIPPATPRLLIKTTADWLTISKKSRRGRFFGASTLRLFRSLVQPVGF